MDRVLLAVVQPPEGHRPHLLHPVALPPFPPLAEPRHVAHQLGEPGGGREVLTRRYRRSVLPEDGVWVDGPATHEKGGGKSGSDEKRFRSDTRPPFPKSRPEASTLCPEGVGVRPDGSDRLNENWWSDHHDPRRPTRPPSHRLSDGKVFRGDHLHPQLPWS